MTSDGLAGLAALVTTLIGVLTAFTAAAFTRRYAEHIGRRVSQVVADKLFGNQDRATDHPSLDRRAQRLSQTLNEAISLIAQIEAEIRTGQAKATQLQSEIQTLEQTASLTKEQAEAVSALVQTSLQQESSKEFKRSLAMNFAFFVLGAITSVVTTLVFT